METATKIAEEVVEKFNKEWEPMMENVREAAETFDNLEGSAFPSKLISTLP